MAREIKVKLITSPSCNGNTKLLAIYQPSKKVFITTGRHSDDYETPVGKMFESLLSSKGAMSERFTAFVNQIPEFKKLYSQLKNSLVEKYKEGQQVVYFDHTDKPSVWVVGKVTNFKKVCDYGSKKSRIVCTREIINSTTGHTKDVSEGSLKPLETLREFEEGKKAVFAFRKALKKEGLVGGELFYKGKAYKF